MNLDLIVAGAVGHLGKEKVEEFLGLLIGLSDKMKPTDTYMIKRLPSKGVVLFTSNDEDCTVTFHKPPKQNLIEKTVRDIEI